MTPREGDASAGDTGDTGNGVDGDFAELATALDLPATWYEVGMTNGNAHQVDAVTAARARRAIADFAIGVAVEPLTFRTISGADVHTRAALLVDVSEISPAYRRTGYLLELLREREQKHVERAYKSGEDF